MNAITLARLLATLLLLCVAFAVRAEAVIEESVLTVRFPDRSLAALVSRQTGHGPLKRAVLLFPGHPGIMRIESADAFRLKGNFLVRSRRHWLDHETVTLAVDAPSDEWYRFFGNFRASERYAEDIRGLARQIEKSFGRLEWVVVGTSEGSVSAYFAARALAPERVKVIFSSSLFEASRTSPGLASLDFADFKVPMLWVHHASDPCRWTPYWQARRHAEKTGAPLITVDTSHPGRGEPCEAFSPHGFAGVEAQTVRAMKRWVVDGVAEDVREP